MIDLEFPYFGIDDYFQFPAPDTATEEGIIAVGGNLSPGMLVSAYRQGIFPWFSEGDPLLWWSPDPRCVLFPRHVHISKSMKRFLRKNPFDYSIDRDFEGVIYECARIPRDGQDGTWITGEMIEAYTRLHNLGFAHSLEVWFEGVLAGGIYGISLGGMFFGESMFSRVPNASKAAFIALAGFLEGEGFDCLDCQLPTPHLLSLGAESTAREEYLKIIKGSLQKPDRIGSWADAGSSCVSASRGI